MVVGIERFREHFVDHEHQFVLIGGAACDLLMSEVALEFRATKDLDIVLIVEALDEGFSEKFWAFVEDGEYEVRQRSGGTNILYRFQKPKNTEYPAMLELFSRTPPGITVTEGSHLTPLPIAEEVASLSAILLDSDYYGLLKEKVREVSGVPLLDEAALIPFKARAWVDLTQRKDAGEDVKSDDIKKHRNDVARLLQLLPADAIIELPEKIRKDMQAFIDALEQAEGFDPQSFQVEMTRETVIERLRKAYAA